MSDAGLQAPVNQPTLGGHGEPCRECGAPLAADQRYCLNCGARRGDARVDYRSYMQQPGSGSTPPQASSEAPQSPGAEEPAKKQRDYTPLAAVGGIAVLGVMLLIGVLIGKGGSDNTVSTPPPVVVKGGSEESGSSPESGGGASAQSKGENTGAGGGKSKGASKKSGGSNPVEASSQALNELNSESGKNYVEESKKIPDEVVTPGKPPPIDKSKPPGGGEGGGVTIE